MFKILNIVTVLCTLMQPGYLEENNIYQPSSASGHNGPYPPWPFQVPTVKGNYNLGVRRHKKPCTRRINSNDPSSENADSEWIQTYTSRVVKPLEENNIIVKSRSLRDRNSNIKPKAASGNEGDLTTLTEKPLSQKVKEQEKPILRNDSPCATTITTTTEGVAYRTSKDYEQIEPNYEYYDVLEDSNDPKQYDNDSRVDEYPEIITNNCNNKIDHDGNSRRFLSQHDEMSSYPSSSVNDKQSMSVLHSNKTEIDPQVAQNNNMITPNLQPTEDIYDRNENGRLGLYNLNTTKTRRNEIENNLMEPTKGRGITHMTDSKVMLMKNTKVCYACSSVSDPTCWNPDRRTTVKYCRVGHDSCVTKTIRNTNTLIMIRDCGHSCDDTDVTGLISRYKSCSICHYDLCNGAYSIKIYNFMFLASLLAVTKYSL